jgi:nondiscriminating glutamyl-tRNA synthetase
MIMTRVRFAPSPTGNLHIGSARAALFNWVFARNQKGKYILRIEDTDLERSNKAFEEDILAGLAWLGLDMDEGPGIGGDYGPYRQSERIEAGIYQKYAQNLLDSGHAYYCFCTDAELTKERDEAFSKKENYVYSRKCLKLTEQVVADNIAKGVPYAIKFKMPDKELTYTDLIRGEVSFDLKLFSDYVAIKSDKTPSYNFAVVVDDMLMAITHVIRGEDHISNTPKQLCLYNAFGKTPPKFAHLPMILGEDRSKLSKRHGATSVKEYQKMGYLSDTLFNYLMLLGWSPKDNQEIMQKLDITNSFSLDKISKSGAIFDIKKLKWMNGQYIRNMSSKDLFKLSSPYIGDDLLSKLSVFSENQQEAVVFSFVQKLELLADIRDLIPVYLYNKKEYQANLRALDFSEQDERVVTIFKAGLTNISKLTKEGLNQIIDRIMVDLSLGKGKVMKPIRFATTAQKSGPDLFAFLEIMGTERLLERLEWF